MTPPRDPATIDLNDPRLYDDPWDVYRWLRDEHPVWFDANSQMFAISRYDDVLEISRHPERYSAANGVRPLVPVPMSILSRDDPEHSRQRRLMSRGFTPKQVRALAEHITDLTQQILDTVEHRGRIDFVEEFAIHVPLIVIAEMLGLDPESRDKLYKWSDAMMDGDGHLDPDDPVLERAAVAFFEYTTVCTELIEARRTDPLDDIISILTQAYDAGELAWTDEMKAMSQNDDQLSNDELLMFLALLVVAGNETTRNAISGGLRAFSQFPGEQQRLVADPSLMETAVDEILRFTTPVISFMRTVTEDHELHGVPLAKGDRVLLLYQSANRDERMFDDPDTFCIDRSPNNHVAFGFGPHFCLGSNLAKVELSIVFGELFRRLPDIRVAEPAAPLQRGDSALVMAIQHLEAVFTPVGA